MKRQGLLADNKRRTVILILGLLSSLSIYAQNSNAYQDALWGRKIVIGVDFGNPKNKSILNLREIITNKVKDSTLTTYTDETLREEEKTGKFMRTLGAITPDPYYDDEGILVYPDSLTPSDADPSSIISLFMVVTVRYSLHEATVKKEILALCPVVQKSVFVGDTEEKRVYLAGWVSYKELQPILEDESVFSDNIYSSITVHEFLTKKIMLYNDYVYKINNAANKAIWQFHGSKDPFEPNINTIMEEARARQKLLKMERIIYKY